MTRTCATPGCTTRLNSYNRDAHCYLCQDLDRIPPAGGRVWVCKVCEAAFKPPRGGRYRYCSDACRVEGRRQSKRAYELRTEGRA